MLERADGSGGGVGTAVGVNSFTGSKGGLEGVLAASIWGTADKLSGVRARDGGSACAPEVDQSKSVRTQSRIGRGNQHTFECISRVIDDDQIPMETIECGQRNG